MLNSYLRIIWFTDSTRAQGRRRKLFLRLRGLYPSFSPLSSVTHVYLLARLRSLTALQRFDLLFRTASASWVGGIGVVLRKEPAYISHWWDKPSQFDTSIWITSSQGQSKYHVWFSLPSAPVYLKYIWALINCFCSIKSVQYFSDWQSIPSSLRSTYKSMG